MKKTALIVVILLAILPSFGQKKIDEGDKLVFVYVEKRDHNLIAIPNLGRLHSFKIFRKQKSDTAFRFIIEKKRPILPMRDHIGPYGVTWEDPEYHTRDIDYRVIAFDKKGIELCEMTIIWDKGSQ